MEFTLAVAFLFVVVLLMKVVDARSAGGGSRERAQRPRSTASRGGDGLPYRRRPSVFSDGERSFYEVLRRVVPEHTVFAKVRMSDLLKVPKGSSEWQTHFNKIQGKHADFVVCDAQLMPLVVIELDDASHSRADRRERDQFVDAAYAAAGLPIFHMRARRGYVPDELRALLAPHLPGAALPVVGKSMLRAIPDYSGEDEVAATAA